MYNVKNLNTGKLIKDAITGKTWTFETKEHADKWAASMNRDNPPAMRNRPNRYVTVPAL